MKKSVIFVLLLSLLPLLSCSQKKNRLTADTLTITVDPSEAQSVRLGSTLSLNAICKSARSDSVDISPVWSVVSSPPNNGTFTPSSGRSTVFKGTLLGSGTIYATYGGVRGGIPVTVALTNVPGGGGGGNGGGVTRLTLLGDAEADTDLVKDGGGNIALNWFDTDNSGGGSDGWQIDTTDAGSGCPSDPINAIKAVYHSRGGTAGSDKWGGFFLAYSLADVGPGATKSLAGYTNMVFYVRGASGGERFRVGMRSYPLPGRSNDIDVTDYITGHYITTSWQRVSIPLTVFKIEHTSTPIDLIHVQQPFIAVFTDSYSGDATVNIDYIGFE